MLSKTHESLLCSWLITLLALFATATVSAESVQRFEEGMALMQQGKYQEAVPVFGDVIVSYRGQDPDEYLFRSMDQLSRIHLIYGRLDSCFSLYDRATDLAEQFGFDKWLVQFTLDEIGLLAMSQSEKEAWALAEEILPVAAQFPLEHSRVLQSMGEHWRQAGLDRDSAKYYFDKSMEISLQLNDSTRIAAVHRGLSTMYYNSGSYLSSIDHNLKAVNFLAGRNPIVRFTIFLTVAKTFLLLDQNAKARDYTLQAIAIGEEHGYTKSLADAALFLGTLESNEDNYEVAAEHLKSAIQAYRKRKNSDDLVAAYCTLSSVYRNLNEVEASAAYLDTASQFVERASQRYYSWFLRARGLLHHKQGRMNSAISDLEQALQLVREIQGPEIELELLYDLKEVYKQQGNARKALEYGEAYLAFNDSLYQLEQNQLLFDTEARYQKAEQDKTIAALNTQNELNEMTLQLRNRQLLVFGVGILGLLLIAGLIFRNARMRKKNNSVLAEKNTVISKALEEKDLLLREIHHRVKNNLQVVSSLLSLQSRFIEDETALEAISEGRDRVKSMALIHQNLYQEENLTGIEIKTYFEKLISGLFASYNIQPDRIVLNQEIADLNLDVDTVIPLGLIVNELVSNALKYAFPDKQEGEIRVRLQEKDGRLILQVADNGIGMQGVWTEEESQSFGYRLIHAFKNKLKADLDVNTKNGTAVTLRIKDYSKAG